MKTEYRELNAVIKAIWSVKISPNAEIFNALKKAIEEEVKNIEPVDVEEIVRCKDCIYKDTCEHLCSHDENWFCGDGKRKQDL